MKSPTFIAGKSKRKTAIRFVLGKKAVFGPKHLWVCIPLVGFWLMEKEKKIEKPNQRGPPTVGVLLHWVFSFYAPQKWSRSLCLRFLLEMLLIFQVFYHIPSTSNCVLYYIQAPSFWGQKLPSRCLGQHNLFATSSSNMIR